jgi:phage terminase Nu1 subunit (DNA packaging protein)
VTTKTADVDGKVMAGLLGITGRRLAQLEAQGVLAPIRRGRAAESSVWSIRITIQAYIAYKLKETQRDRLFRLQADRVALENGRRRQELLEAAEVEKEWAEIATAVKRAVLALPGRLFQIGVITSDKIAPATEAAHEVLRALGKAGA